MTHEEHNSNSAQKTGEANDLKDNDPQPIDAIRPALPNWPSDIHDNAVWLELCPWDSLFAHHPGFSHSTDSSPGTRIPNVADNDDVGPTDGKIRHDPNHHYCIPKPEYKRLLSVFKNSQGGSILVSGYRGTGKTSFVNRVVEDLLGPDVPKERRHIPKAPWWKFWNRRKGGNGSSDSRETQKQFIPIRINLSTSRTAEALVMMMLKGLETEIGKADPTEARVMIHEACRRFRSQRSSTEATTRTDSEEKTTRLEVSGWVPLLLFCFFLLLVALGQDVRSSLWAVFWFWSAASIWLQGIPWVMKHFGRIERTGTKRSEDKNFEGQTFVEKEYPVHEAQQDLFRILNVLSAANMKVIFILDEVDKLTPDSSSGDSKSREERLKTIQKLVSDLKFLLTESAAFHVFIAGKDVDDSWQEDQNKGEGLFESIFVQNIYLPSTFSAILEPALGPHYWLIRTFRKYKNVMGSKTDLKEHDWVKKVFKIVLEEVGIDHRSWTYNTGLLVLPLFSGLEIWKILLRYKKRSDPSKKNNTENGKDRTENKAEGDAVECDIVKWMRFLQEDGSEVFSKEMKALSGAKEGLDQDHKNVDPMTERRIRRIRYLVEYLTYKGRGIPRKILREFYALVRNTEMVVEKDKEYWERRGSVELIIYSPATVRQKIKFFASIVSQIDANRDRFRFLNDKGCVAIFHIIDHILKHFQTGFSWADLENATFMTRREELFPSRELLRTLLAVFEDHLFEARDRRHQSFRLLPRVKHDLNALYQAFGPEQIELRFTSADFSTEIAGLTARLAEVGATGTGRCFESVKAQIRLAKIFELLGNHEEARQQYSKALRWIRGDLRRLHDGPRTERLAMMTMTTTMTYLVSANTVLSRLGYLYELDRDFRTALHYYETIVRFLEGAQDGMVVEEESRSFCSIMGPTMKINATPGWANTVERVFPTDDQVVRDRSSELRTLILRMLPEGNTVVSPFSSGLPGIEGNESLLTGRLPDVPRVLHTGFESKDMARALNRIAIVLEKLWHRYAANRFLVNALDYHLRCGDEYNTIDQMMFIGELMIRRRDVRLGAGWYLEALRRTTQLQISLPDDYTSRQPEVQTSAKARLLEYLGDVWYATRGTAFVDVAKLRESNGREEIEKAMNEIRKQNTWVYMDGRDDEFFYTQAAYLFGRNQQTLRQCDVLLKKLQVRRNRLSQTLRENNMLKGDGSNNSGVASTENERALDPKMRLAWGDYWAGAERTYHSLIDVNPGTRRVSLMGVGRIIDRRRYGELLTSVGRMLMLAVEAEKESWCWKPVDESEIENDVEFAKGMTVEIREKHGCGPENIAGSSKFFELIIKDRVRLENTTQRIRRITGSLVANSEIFNELGEPDQEELCKKDGIRIGSPLWNLGRRTWREDKNNKGQPNQFLIGQLFYALKLEGPGDKSEGSGDTEKSQVKPKNGRENASVTIVRTLYRAEVCLLSAHLALDDNIRGLEAAAASRSLGVLYLVAILKVFFGEDGCLIRPDEHQRIRLYNALHIASKRFLVNSIDVLRGEADRNRASSHELLRAQQALGDLMTIRSEVLGTSDQTNRRGEAGILGKAKKMFLGGSGKPEAKELLKSPLCKDIDVEDCRVQAFEAYRDCLRTVLSDFQDYINRYRFPEEAMYQHGDVMNRRLHWDIAQSIRSRHPGYRSAGNDESGGSLQDDQGFQGLKDVALKLSVVLFDPQPLCKDRKLWIEGLSKILDLLNETAVRPNWIAVSGEDQGERTVIPRRLQESEDSLRFFRSFDDGLGRRVPNDN